MRLNIIKVVVLDLRLGGQVWQLVQEGVSALEVVEGGGKDL